MKKIVFAAVLISFLMAGQAIGKQRHCVTITNCCDKVTISGAILQADCSKSDWSRKQTSINLDAFIEDHQGQLRWGGGDYKMSRWCKDVNVAMETKRTVLRANCDKGPSFWPRWLPPEYTSSELNLDERIGVDAEGNLQYVGE